MFKRVGLLMLAGASLAMAQDAVKVSPAEIAEKRSATFIKKENFFSSDHDALTLTLHIEGPSLVGATKYGRFKIISGTDDLGTALTLEKKGFHPEEGLTEISRFGQQDKTDHGVLDVPVEMSLPARKATAIVELKGEFQVLAGGEEKVVKVGKLSTQLGKPVNDPVLKAAGLVVTPTKIDAEQKELTVEYSGTMDAIKNVEIVDASGKKISSGGSMTMNLGTKQSTTYSLSEAPGDGASVQLHLMAGQKAVTVPFDLKGIKLP